VVLAEDGGRADSQVCKGKMSEGGGRVVAENRSHAPGSPESSAKPRNVKGIMISMRKKEKPNPLERLLNVREAAEFLNVSEMTVRRWTNEGSLQV